MRGFVDFDGAVDPQNTMVMPVDVAATVFTDEKGNYSVAIPAMGNYSLEASKHGYGYGKVTAPDLIEISDTIPNQTVDLIMEGNGRRNTHEVRYQLFF